MIGAGQHAVMIADALFRSGVGRGLASTRAEERESWSHLRVHLVVVLEPARQEAHDGLGVVEWFRYWS